MQQVSSEASSNFEGGDEAVKIMKVKSSSSRLPCPLSVFSPTARGTYPVLLFFHGFMCKPNFYNSLLQHISSHRYIIVAPQFSPMAPQSNDVKNAKKVAKWLSTGLTSVLPEKVVPNLLKVAVSGHSRGGKTAFALALGYGGSSSNNSSSSSFKFSGILGIDPVAGNSPSCLCPPNILQFIPYSFDQPIPVAVIGTGLGNQRACGVCPPGAPNGVNHAEFFNESKPPCYYFLAKDYGHADMLEDRMAKLMSLMMKSGKGSKDSMRRGVGGIVVAFLKAYLDGQADDLNDIVQSPNLAPITLNPVISIKD